MKKWERDTGGRREGGGQESSSQATLRFYHAAMEKKSGSGLGTRLGRKKEGRGMWQMKRRAG